MQQVNSGLAHKLKTWRSYGELTRAVAFDYEQALAVRREREGYARILADVASVTSTANLKSSVTVSYCNRTGQPIGLAFVGKGDEELGYSASIAPQWIKTGPQALAEHVKETPIAYTVYLVGKLLDKPDTVSGVNDRVSLLAGLYAVISGRDNSSISEADFNNECSTLVSSMQTALWVCSKLAKISKAHHYGVMYNTNIEELMTVCKTLHDPKITSGLDDVKVMAVFKKALIIWVANVLGRLTEQEMPFEMFREADCLELAESFIARGLGEVSRSNAKGETSIPLDVNMTAFSNLPQAGRAQVSGWGKTKAKEKATKRIVEGLGNIFAMPTSEPASEAGTSDESEG